MFLLEIPIRKSLFCILTSSPFCEVCATGYCHLIAGTEKILADILSLIITVSVLITSFSILTSGPFCEVCATGYYGSADMGTPYDCMPCPCYEPRVANGTCLVARGTISCLYCAPGYTGALCDKYDLFLLLMTFFLVDKVK